jgi:hypothetical protein
LDGGLGPDQKLSQKPGGPCPCLKPLHCVNGLCRKECTSQPCNGPGGCAASEACINTENNTPVCVPGVGKGKPCSADSVCAGGLLCLAADQEQNGTCYATCTTTCGGGSTCFSIKGSTCRFCFP